MRYNDAQDEPPTTRVLLRVEKQRVRVRYSFWIMAYLCNLNWQLKKTREKQLIILPPSLISLYSVSEINRICYQPCLTTTRQNECRWVYNRRRERCSVLCEKPQTPRAGHEYIRPPIAGQIGKSLKMVVIGVEQPAIETRPLGFMAVHLKLSPFRSKIPMPHGLEMNISSTLFAVEIRRGQERLSLVFSSQPLNRVPFGFHGHGAESIAAELEYADTPRTPDHDFIGPVTIEIPNRPEPIIGRVEQPPAEPGAIRFDQRIAECSAAHFEDTDPQGLVIRISCRPSPSKSPTGPNHYRPC